MRTLTRVKGRTSTCVAAHCQIYTIHTNFMLMIFSVVTYIIKMSDDEAVEIAVVVAVADLLEDGNESQRRRYRRYAVFAQHSALYLRKLATSKHEVVVSFTARIDTHCSDVTSATCDNFANACKRPPAFKFRVKLHKCKQFINNSCGCKLPQFL